MDGRKLLDDVPDWGIVEFDDRNHDPRDTWRGRGIKLGDSEVIREGRVWQVTETA